MSLPAKLAGGGRPPGLRPRRRPAKRSHCPSYLGLLDLQATASRPYRPKSAGLIVELKARGGRGELVIAPRCPVATGASHGHTLLTGVGIRIEPTMADHTMDATNSRYD